LIKLMRPVVERYDRALADARKLARGIRSELRVGYLVSAGPSLLTPALARFRKAHGNLKLKLHDMSPGEQINALRAGELDIALVGQEGAAAARDFYSLKLHSFDVVAALSTTDPLARRKQIHLRDLSKHAFIGVDEHEVPGRNQWMIALCRKAGFKPRFLVVTDGITNVLSEVVSEAGVTLLPGYFRNFSHPDVVFVPIADTHARWDCIVLWQRGSPPPAARALVDALAATARLIGQ
jgi:DNA-binding transcriptional LysR family regulator